MSHAAGNSCLEGDDLAPGWIDSGKGGVEIPTDSIMDDKEGMNIKQYE